MIEETLQKIAKQIMALNEETLTALLPRYKERMMNFAPTQQWEESVVIYFLINGLRIKNSQFNDKIREYAASGENGEKVNPHIRPRLRLIKTSESEASDCPDGPCSDDCSKKQFTVCQSRPDPGDEDSGARPEIKAGADKCIDDKLMGKMEQPEDPDEA